MIDHSPTIQKELDRVLAESRIADLEKAFSELPVDSVPELVRLKEEFANIKEEITAGDWGRIGVIAGMLWYKLDIVISNLSTAVNALRNIERNTSKIK
jgi:hypothetical protein